MFALNTQVKPFVQGLLRRRKLISVTLVLLNAAGRRRVNLQEGMIQKKSGRVEQMDLAQAEEKGGGGIG